MIDTYRNIGVEIDKISAQNKGKNLLHVSENDLHAVANLVVGNYVQYRESPYTETQIINAIRFQPRVYSEDLSPNQHMDYQPKPKRTLGTYDLDAGIIDIWLAAKPFNVSYLRTIPSMRNQTPITLYAQALSHEVHHKGAADPNNPSDSGFSEFDNTLNETTTELLRIVHDLRSGIDAISMDQALTRRMQTLIKLMADSGITEPELFEQFQNRNYLGLAVIASRSQYPQQVAVILEQVRQQGNQVYESDSKDLMTVLTHGLPLIRKIS